MRARRTLGLLLLCGAAGLGQRLLSARAGTVNWARGAVFIDAARAFVRPNALLLLGEGQTLRTDRGRVELLLGERVYLRMIESSAVHMENSHMDDTRVSIEDGSVLIEVVQVRKGANLHILCEDSATELRSAGVYRFDTHPCNLRVYRGEALVASGSMPLKPKAGQAVNLAGDAAISRFDPKETDSLYTWSEQRWQQRISRERRIEETRAMIRARRRMQMEENQ